MEKGVRLEKERVKMKRTKGDPPLELQGSCDPLVKHSPGLDQQFRPKDFNCTSSIA